jgi:hypothetical protein
LVATTGVVVVPSETVKDTLSPVVELLLASEIREVEQRVRSARTRAGMASERLLAVL